MIEPILERSHPVGAGTQKLYRFNNGYGASVVRFMLPIPIGTRRYGSYTNNENEWEVAVVKFNGDGDEDWEFAHETAVAGGDVIGYVHDDDLQELLSEIKRLNKSGNYRGKPKRR